MYSSSFPLEMQGNCVPVDYSTRGCKDIYPCFTLQQIFDNRGIVSNYRDCCNHFGPGRYIHDGRIFYNPSETLNYMKFPPDLYNNINGTVGEAEIQKGLQESESKTTWRNFQSGNIHLENDLESQQQKLYDIKKRKREEFEADHSDITTNMALTNGKKLCKLDAICAKLKKINKDTTGDDKPEHNRIPTENERQNVEVSDDCPTDLSVKCLNNNVIGKIDLHYTENNECLDLTTAKTEHENGNISRETVVILESNKDSIETKANVSSLTVGQESENKSEDGLQSKSGLGKRPTVTPVSVGSSRRKSRKAATPRNITQVRDFYDQIDDKDELAEYEINNQNTNFPPDELDENELEERDISTTGRGTLSRSNPFADEDSNSSIFNNSRSSNNSKQSSLNHSKDSRKSLPSSDFEGAPLDLSVNKSNDGEEFIHNDLSSDDDDDDDDDFFHPDRNLVIDEDKLPISKSESLMPNSPKENHHDSGGEQEARLKDYAESTMNELISMYGFGASGQTNDISKQIPMNSYSTILNHANASQFSALSSKPQGGATIQNQPINSGDEESLDGSLSGKGIFASFTKSGQSTPVKGEGNNSKLQNDRFTSSSSFINAVYGNASTGQGERTSQGKTLLPNYSKYLKRYNSGSECGGKHCLDLSYKEHYHCIDCSFQVFVKKEEMVRHYKWHKKREESLQHGFLRFSPLDSCSKRFGSCTHNGKQTHYHCLQSMCDKVYISTSDVQMHANYHRKDSAIMSEGFQRFRATEDCGTLVCAFYGQRTTHFHCLRSDCRFTFKNKADMEKHKSYHQKDEVLGRDGFKKFMKYEHCMYQGCRYSKVSNHIHCIRSGCDYVLHSTAQLYSHKRKHERRDFENAYKRYRDSHQPNTPKPIQPAPSEMTPQRNFSSIGQIPTSVIQSVASLTALKRHADHDQVQPLELKKPKIEPGLDSDMSTPAPSSGRSTPVDKLALTPKLEYESMDEDDFGSSAEKKTPRFRDTVDLNNSLTLPIPNVAAGSSELVPTTSLMTQIQHLKPPTIPSTQSLSALNNSMPGTLTGALVNMNPGTLMTVSSAKSTALQPPKSVYTERREKDDSWKTYLVRYTANDPCNPRCQYLYKDHYHCKMDGCLVLFKSKDGVREHARFHELQDRITPIAYHTYESSEACPVTCQYSEKQKHFHCIWTDCTHVVPYVGPTFGRLEHYRIHEYARAAAGKSYSRSPKGVGSIEDNSMRRRGRPPKYPKIEAPKIPKVELTDEEIRLSHGVFNDSDMSSKMKVVNGFRVFSADDPCPDEQCTFVGTLHYHCARPRCFTITERMDVLNLHAKDFHSFVKILDGFEFFDRNVSCRRLHCPNNQTNRHFHCTRPKCDYSFIRHSTMAQHDKKHAHAETGRSGFAHVKELPLSPTSFHRDVPIKPANIKAIMPAAITPSFKPTTLSATQMSQVTPVITSTGAFVPVPNMNIPLIFSQDVTQVSSMHQGSVIIPPQPVDITSTNLAFPQVSLSPSMVSSPDIPLALSVSSVQALPASITSTQLVSGISAPLISAGSAALAVSAVNNTNIANSTAPLTVLLQRGVNQIPQPSWNDLKARMHYAIAQNCGRPFCKLKKKDHFHCYDCNQAFSDPARLRSHIGKHGIKIKRQDQGDRPITNSKLLAHLSPPSTEIKLTTTVEGIETNLDLDEAKCLAEGAEVEGNDSETDDELKSSSLSSSSLNLNPSTFSEMISKAQEQNKMSPVLGASSSGDEGQVESQLPKLDVMSEMDGNQSDSNDQKMDKSSRSGRKLIKTKHEGFMNSGEINLSKQRRSSSPRSSNGKMSGKFYDVPVTSPKTSNIPIPAVAPARGIKDDSVPCGYSRWRYNEECRYAKCAYRHSVTHFHCIRDDCGYGFSDRSRLVQHSLRHERIDSITGGELQQYRINQDCENVSCEYNKKMSHFHCKRCSYCCTDSSKVLTHRKYHAKLDNITNQGFQKYSAADDCSINICPYSRKQNHFHCLVESCQAAVLGPAQMTSHKVKHSTINEDS